jgi:hypothetical protein
MTNTGRVINILMRSEEGRDALATFGEAWIADLAESPNGSLIAWQEMAHANERSGLQNLANLHQRVMGALEESKGWF